MRHEKICEFLTEEKASYPFLIMFLMKHAVFATSANRHQVAARRVCYETYQNIIWTVTMFNCKGAVSCALKRGK